MNVDNEFIKTQYMRMLSCLFAIGMLWICISDCFSQGLLFYGNEKRINERATYSVLNEKNKHDFSGEFHISFDYSIRNFESLGYILYLEDREGGKTYSFTYLYKPDNRCSFSFNEDGKRIFSTFDLEKEDFTHRWIPISITLYPQKDEAEIVIGRQKKRVSNMGLSKENFSPHIYFGKCEYILDVASYAIKNLSLSDGKEHWLFPMNESSGEDVHDSKGHVMGQVTNPVWLINQSYYWKQLFTAYSSTPSGLNFNPQKQEILLFNQDSLSIFDLRTHTLSASSYRCPLPVKLHLGMNFFNEEELYVYEVNADKEELATVAALNPLTLEWRKVGSTYVNMQLHHHCGYYHPTEKKYTLFGGYGSRRYSNAFLSYDIQTDRWDTLTFSGDHITPRYFSGMAVSTDYKRMYLYGGMGNESGDQNIGRNYLYDMYQIDLEHRVVRKLWQQKVPATNRVAARNMLLSDDEKYIYMVGYPEYLPNSYIQLYRLSLSDGHCEAVGDSIPMVSEEIATNVNLFSNKELGEFYCSIQEFEKYGQVTTRVYSLSAPPVTLAEVRYYSNSNKWIIWAIIGLIVACILIVFLCFCYRRRKTKIVVKSIIVDTKVSLNSKSIEISEESEGIFTVNQNAVFLFGVFTVLNRDGRDITYMFSTKLRTIFLYILLNSIVKEGVLSSDMNDLFWADKPDANIKNLKGVTMNHLRKIVQDIDGVELIFQKGYFRFVFTDDFYCDYIHFATLSIDSKQGDFVEKINMDLISILSRGKFLATIELDLFDYNKQQVEEFIHSFLPEQIMKAYQNHKFDSAIRFCNILFATDSFSDVALAYTLRSFIKQSRQEEAVRRYNAFAKDYKKTMGEDYPIAYSDISN